MAQFQLSRREQAERLLVLLAEVADGHSMIRPGDFECSQCGRPFTASRSDAECCSDRCRKAKQRARQAA